MTNDDRERTRMFIINAVGFKEAAAATYAAPGMFHWPAFYMLLCFSIELSLKAFLASRGLTEQELKRIGHELSTAFQKAVKLGLSEHNPKFRTLLTQVSEAHRLHEFRYLKSKSIEIVEPQEALDILEDHIRNMGAQIPVSRLDSE